MITEISKTVVEKVIVCDIAPCQHTAEYKCIICNKDICREHYYCVIVRGVLKYLCTSCSNKPFSEIDFEINHHNYPPILYTMYSASAIYPLTTYPNYLPSTMWPWRSGTDGYWYNAAGNA